MVRYTIFIGNPGTGKSTLLNALIGKPLFRSGVSFGKGMTTVLQLRKSDNGDYYGDTPGLADVKMRKKAAEEMSKALRSGDGDYKLVFVVTEEAGRVRPADGVTMKLVLDALPKEHNVPFGIIVNKMSKRKMRDLDSDNEKFLSFAACLNEGPENPTPHIHLYPKIEELEDATDKLHEPTPAFKQFLDMLPPVHIKPDDVEDVKANDFDPQIKVLEMQAKMLRDDNEALQRKISSHREKVKKQIAKMKKEQEAALAKARKESQKKMKELEERQAEQITKMHAARNENVVIVNPQSGKALDVWGGNTANGSTINLWERNRTGAQIWKICQDGTIVNPQSGKALDVNGGNSVNGTKIQLWERNGSAAQKWTFHPDGTIINPQSGKALDVNGGKAANGTKIHLWERNGTGAQKWQLVSVHERIAEIVNPQSGKALDVSGGNTANGTKIQLWERNSTGAQKWILCLDGTIINPQSGKALDVCGGNTATGTKIQLWERNGTGAQKWDIREDGTIVNHQSGKALDVNGGKTANGTKIHLWDCNGSGAQKWHIRVVG